MNRWDVLRDGKIYQDIMKLEDSTLSIYALESFAIIVDNVIQNDLLRDLVLSHAEIAQELEVALKQLEVSENQLNEAQSIAQMGRWDVNFITGEERWSKSLRRILMLDDSLQASTSTFLELIYPEDRAIVDQIVQDIKVRKEPWVIRYRLLLRDGSIHWVQVNLRTEFDESGNLLRSFGTLQDITAMREVEIKLEQYSKHLEEMVAAKVKETSDAQIATIFALVKLAESRDDETGAHIERTASFCRLLAEKARTLPQYASIITDEYLTAIYRASPLHDIGKVGISDLILLKPGKLTPEEFAIMKTHVEIGYQTLKSVDNRYMNNSFIQMGLDITRYHHEKWDGSGYLAELQGEDIPLSARIMALSDVYDALRSKRVYKPAYTHEKSMEIIEEGRGKHFDPTLTDLFLAHNKEFEALFDSLI